MSVSAVASLRFTLEGITPGGRRASRSRSLPASAARTLAARRLRLHTAAPSLTTKNASISHQIAVALPISYRPFQWSPSVLLSSLRPIPPCSAGSGPKASSRTRKGVASLSSDACVDGRPRRPSGALRPQFSGQFGFDFWSIYQGFIRLSVTESLDFPSATMVNPMHLAPRCGAKTRRGTPCRAPAMPSGRCRMHGGLSPGAPPDNRYAWKHGRYSREAIERSRELAVLIRSRRDLARRIAT